MRLISREKHPSEPNGTNTAMYRIAFRTVGLACVATMLTFTCTALPAQQAPSRDPDRPYIIPEANPLPDANDRMIMREQKTKKQNFDAANTLRTRQIIDDTAKLLILTRDLKAQTNKLGSAPLPPV